MFVNCSDWVAVLMEKVGLGPLVRLLISNCGEVGRWGDLEYKQGQGGTGSSSSGTLGVICETRVFDSWWSYKACFSFSTLVVDTG